MRLDHDFARLWYTCGFSYVMNGNVRCHFSGVRADHEELCV